MSAATRQQMSSWIESAQASDGDFPIQNLPYGVFQRDQTPPRCGLAIGDQIVDLFELERAGLLSAGPGAPVFGEPALNAFMARGAPVWTSVRARLTALLSEGGDPALRDDGDLRARALVPQADATLRLPFKVAGYTDFYAGRQHATNVGTLLRGPENALPPNWLSIPIGYNGRASTVVASGTPIRRPLGQTRPAGAELPVFGPTRRLDIELEIGAVVGTPSRLGEPITVGEAEAMIFGFVLLNDWSARDIQAWEYQPLGPFQAKAFATTISPWVVTSEALAPFRRPGPKRDRPLLPYLLEPGPMLYDINLSVRMRPAGSPEPAEIARTNARELYYSAAQQLAHHAVCGCKMDTGDLLGSGTISGAETRSRGSLLELTWGGAEPLSFGAGVQRTFLEDGDEMTLAGWAEGPGYRIGFGECVGRILPAPTDFVSKLQEAADG